VVTVIAAMRTFTAQLLKLATGRPLRLAAADAVQPPNAAVVPDDSGRRARRRTAGPEVGPKRFFAASSFRVIRVVE